MFSWLNFEELLIHNPIDLINPSKDTISVAMNKKQYIEFFSNKYTYNGLYYDEEMDFCLFYYADPLQSVKEGDVYAQGYIDVEMKIYRVKWLCNVSISRFGSNSNFNLLRGTAKFDGFNPNSSNNSVSTITKIKLSGIDNTVMDVRTSGNAFAVGLYLHNAYSITAGQTITISFMARGTNGTKVLVGFEGITNGLKEFRLTPNWELYTHTFTATTSGTHNFLMYGWDMDAGQWFQVYNPKAELGYNATSYMQSESESRHKWNVSKTEMVVNAKNKTITTVLNGALAKCTKDKDVTGWRNSQPNASYNYRQPQYSLDIGADDFIISGFGLRGLKNG
ncbi:capsid and scaffold protein [Lactococcus phage D4410]|uniref:Capsid and scaffold protein n=1 Tax=Lactococcus phage D4410 TaxID=1862958 RepID=A0A192YB56_9CAUD|nr:virion structural protein [Lactococcus phage D4410]ANM46703.1 capsid and scaffold protein [Lactococcus phage D4410]